MAASLIPHEDPDLYPERESTRLARVGQREFVRRLPPRHALTICEGNGEMMYVTPDLNQQRELLNDISAFGDVLFHPILVPHNASAENERSQKRRKLANGTRSPSHPYERRRKASRPFGWIGHARGGQAQPRRPRANSDGLDDVPQSFNDSCDEDTDRPLPTSDVVDLTGQHDRERDVPASVGVGGGQMDRSILGLSSANRNYLFTAWSYLTRFGGRRVPDGYRRVKLHPNDVSREYSEEDLKHNYELHSPSHRAASPEPEREPDQASPLDQSQCSDDPNQTFLERARNFAFGSPLRLWTPAKKRRRQSISQQQQQPQQNPLHTLGRGNDRTSAVSEEKRDMVTGAHAEPVPDTRFNLTFTTGHVQEAFECPVIALACHPVRPEVAFATHDDRVSFYEFVTGKISTLTLSSELQRCVADVKYSPSGTQLATACLNGVCLWTFRNASRVRTKAEEMSADTSFQIFADANPNSVRKGVDARSAWMQFLPQTYANNNSVLAWSTAQQALTGVSFSPCGRYLAAWHDESPSAAVWAIDRNPPTMTTYSVPHIRVPGMGYQRHISEIRWSQAFGNNNALVISRVTPFGVDLASSLGTQSRPKVTEYSDWRVDIVSTDTFETQSAFPLPGPVNSSAWHATRQKFVLAVGPRLVEQFEFREKTDLSNRERFFKFPEGKLVDEHAFRPSAARFVDGKPYYRPGEHEKLGEPLREKYPGGDVHLIRWSADARRLAISFKPNLDKKTNNCSELIAVFNTTDSEMHPATLLGYIRGPPALNDTKRLNSDFRKTRSLKFDYDHLEQRQAQEKSNSQENSNTHLHNHSQGPLLDSDGFVINYPVHMEFAPSYEKGSLLIVVWLGGQVTAHPLIYESGGVRPTKGDNFVENLVPNPHIHAQKSLFGLAKPAADFLNRTLGFQ